MTDWKRNWQIGKESGICGNKVKAWERKLGKDRDRIGHE